ncbi:ArnT family glycosyltransferase [Luteibacter sahnii]|uniref:ArnT family glycosyltransferase n=1 Tax=Luteibacter sahnii TaxID=3021977 RepID=UPI002A6B4329|nr:glycosyltransferase family 39 protein [Luteibacter sp. PPL193]MDY1549861.1 glycosyltransferase family 39 protein [Luteibacter sp. PPL193]
MSSRPLLSIATLGRCLGLLALLALRVLTLRAYPLNSDEPQHAHVAWSIGEGALPYRDVFDNHGPLFSAIYAPLMHALGPRPDILVWLRLAVVPWYLLALVATWYIARRLYSRGVADAAVALTGLAYVFFVKMGEFRTDDLWTALWLCALAVAAHAGRWNGRWLIAGVLLGGALSVSQKTVPLSLMALLAAACIWAAPCRADPKGFLKRGLALLAGVAVVPGAFWIYLAFRHDLGPAWYNLVAYNIAPTGDPSHAWPKVRFALLAAAIVGVVATGLRRAGPVDPSARWRLFVGLHGVLFGSFIWLAWPLPTDQDFLPIIPTLIVCLTGLVSRSGVLSQARAVGFVALLIALELVLLVKHAPPWHDALLYKEAQLRTVLACTSPDDTVMDAKSGAIFRRRPYYTVLESIALRRFRHGLQAEDIAPALVAQHTMTVIEDRLPPATHVFVAQNYLPGMANVFMAGKTVPEGRAARGVDIVLAGNYTVTDGAREVPVSIDGGPASSRWPLSAARHAVDTPYAKPLLLVWTPAWVCGWRPAVVEVAQPEPVRAS